MRNFFLSAATAIGLMANSAQAAENNLIGVVNFATCIAESKAGKKEQENMENIQKQMLNFMEETEKELREIATKLEDPEYRDSLSPKAEEELRNRCQTLQEDLYRHKSQISPVLNHANYQMIQKMSSVIAKAAEKIASEKHLDYVMNKEACFFIRPDLDVTSLVISEMDKNFELEAKAKTSNETSGEELSNFETTSLNQAGE